MIPYPYNMVDMGGIDLAEANGTVVEGLYAKIVEAVDACGDVVLYNWKFAGIEIAPQHTSILIGDPIVINGAVQVTEQDEVTVPGINPEPPEPPEPPVLIQLTAIENGVYLPEDYDADGFSEVSVDVPSSGGTTLENWDLTESFIGKIHGIIAQKSGVNITEDGAVLSGQTSYIRTLTMAVPGEIEIKTGDLHIVSGYHRRFIMYGNKDTGTGLLYRNTGVWSFYNGDWADSSEHDTAFFNNCTVKVVIDSEFKWHIYKNGILFWEPNIPGGSGSYSPGPLVLGSTAGGMPGAVIKEVTIKFNEEIG